MEPIVLTNKLIKPTDDIVFKIIGDRSALWQQIMGYLKNNYSDTIEEWKFYNDGKSWLSRTIKKEKTIFWIGVLENTFRVTFWFGDKAALIIEQSRLSDSIKLDFEKAKRYNKIRPISIRIDHDEDVDNVIKLIDIKIKW